jgi:serine/threonine protein kinase
VSSQEDLKANELQLGFPDERTLVNATQNPSLVVQSSQDLLTEGQVLAGKYKVIEHVGSGGMSVVYKARDQVLGRDVAIKMLSSSRVSDEKSVRRFHQEGTAVGRLNHQNIVSVYDVGLTESGEPFLVMDFAEGKTLTELVSFSGRCSPSRALHLIGSVLDALVHAHEKGVVHRDLKPSNIIVCNPGEESECARVFDFGIAKLMPGADTTSSELTQTGEIFGSPLYMSPEQCLGKPLDGRSDIYSVGCILFELLVGHPPHHAETSVETIIKHIQDEAKSLKESCPGAKFSDGLEAMVRKALAKDPADRYQNAKEMKQAVSALIAELKDSPLPQSEKHTAFRFLEKDPVTLSVVGATGLLVLIFVGFLAWSGFSSPGEKNKPIRAELTSGTMRYMVDEAQLRTESQHGAAEKVEQAYTFSDGVASLSDQDIDDTVIGKLTNTPNLTKINFEYSRLTASNLILGYFSKLEVPALKISGAKFGPEFLQAVSQMKALRSLEMDNMKVPLSESQMEIVCSTPGLTELSLQNSIDVDDALKPLYKLKELRKLKLANCKITDRGLEYVNKCSTLRDLQLNGVRINGRGLRKLASIPKLAQLNVSDCELTDSDMEAISTNSRLENLSLNRCQITDKGLMSLTKLRNLRNLHLSGCSRLTNRGISRFSAKLPWCQIER